MCDTQIKVSRKCILCEHFQTLKIKLNKNYEFVWKFSIMKCLIFFIFHLSQVKFNFKFLR